MMNTQVLKLSKVKSVIFIFYFTALAVMTPIFFHLFGGPALGQKFLPMQIFVLAAGLLLGWRAGLAVGILTPLISWSITRLPISSLLPFVLIEIAIYGLAAGWLREKFKLNIWLSLFGTMIFGRVILFFALLILPTNLNAWIYLKSAIISGWPGILAQLAILPIVVVGIQKFLESKER